ncbi:hypothetical protein KI387_013382 [Taxus chinensis]|uniref:LOB domain-containing protein n=1 Tax=Taxus chinensis TaxID=29808 RepID=A0AA38CSI9_TAXCH|nr:hypothetical protein KI387_013382 [Taxus chinensis]
MKESASCGPCAACKMQRKKCGDKCILAPYFPQNNPEKFLLVHKVFGTGNVIKLLQDVAVEKREEAVASMVFEARERLRDPVNGSSALISHLQRKVAELQSQLANAEDELANIRLEHANLGAILTADAPTPHHFFEDRLWEVEVEVELEPLWM